MNRKIIIEETQLERCKEYIKESPDVIGDFKWHADDTIPFGFIGYKAYLGYNISSFKSSPNISDDARKKLDILVREYGVKSYHVNGMRMHSGIGDFYDLVTDSRDFGHLDTREHFGYPGRLWMKEKMISFWVYPSKNMLPDLLKLISDECDRIYGFKIDFSNYHIEVRGDFYEEPTTPSYDGGNSGSDFSGGNNDWANNRSGYKLIPIDEYIGSKNVGREEMNAIHLLPGEQKIKTPQMMGKAALDRSILARKFSGNVSQAEWNNARRKYQGESVQVLKNKLNESYIGSCVDVGSGNRKRINDYFSDATQMAYYCGNPDDDDYGRSEEISDTIFYKYISRKVVPVKSIRGNVKYFYISDGGRIKVSEAKIFFIYNIDLDVHYFFEKNKLNEDIVIPVTTGDTIMMGKFKNKKTTVKNISKDKHGMPTINGKQATTFRVNKNTEITEAKDYVYGEYNGESISVDNESWDAMPFAYADGRVWVGYSPVFGYEYVEAGYTDYDGSNEYPNYHTDMYDFYRFINEHNYTTQLPPRSNKDYIYWGRVWLESEIISFYKYPKDKNEMKNITNLLSKEIKDVYDEHVNFDNYIVDTTDDGLISMNDYIGSSDVSDDVINTPHLLPANRKRDNKQLASSLKGKYDKLGSKLGNTTQAEYNHYKKYGMGESIENGQLSEATIEDVNLNSFAIKNKLNEKFWNNEKLNVKVRRRLLKIADDFLEFINVDSKYCKDILFLGSLANYNWSRYSDVDLHLLIDFKKINKDIDFVRDYFDVKRRLWNDEHNSLKIYNFPVELYVQDINEDNASTGVFSVEQNTWLKKPSIVSENILNKNKIKQKSADLMTDIDDLKSVYDKNKNKGVNMDAISKKSKQLFDKIKALRKSGLESSKGEYSTGNIVFKVLRRSGHLDILIDLKRNTYDIINTIK